jgi:hypothetical protein
MTTNKKLTTICNSLSALPSALKKMEVPPFKVRGTLTGRTPNVQAISHEGLRPFSKTLKFAKRPGDPVVKLDVDYSDYETTILKSAANQPDSLPFWFLKLQMCAQLHFNFPKKAVDDMDIEKWSVHYLAGLSPREALDANNEEFMKLIYGAAC